MTHLRTVTHAFAACCSFPSSYSIMMAAVSLNPTHHSPGAIYHRPPQGQWGKCNQRPEATANRSVRKQHTQAEQGPRSRPQLFALAFALVLPRAARASDHGFLRRGTREVRGSRWCFGTCYVSSYRTDVLPPTRPPKARYMSILSTYYSKHLFHHCRYLLLHK
jgi:hypothetical protein